MQTHDGWLVRVTPDLEGLSSAQLAFLAERAATQGNGRISLTTRGNLQLRGFEEQAAKLFASDAAEQGLGLADPEREARRRLLFMSPLAGIDPACAHDTLLVARELETALISPQQSWQAPEKYSVAVDGGGLIPSGALRADLMLRHEDGVWCLYHGAERHALNREMLVPLVLERLASSASAANAGRALHQAPPFKGAIPRVLGAFLPGSFGAVAIMGEISASGLGAIAEAEARVRVTPWRGLVMDRPVATPDLIADPCDPRLALTACPGRDGCEQGLASTRQDALFLAPFLKGRRLHVSGCAKGCASRDSSDVTLIARAGGYDLIWQGTTRDHPVETGLDVEDVRRRFCRA